MNYEFSAGLEHSENVRLAHDEQVFTVDGDFGAGVLAVEHLVAHGHLRLDKRAAVGGFAFAHGHNFAALGFLLGRVGDDDAGFGFLLGGEVVAVGEGKTADSGSLIKPQVKVGDQVLYGKYAGTEISVDGEDLLIMRESDIFAVL